MLYVFLCIVLAFSMSAEAQQPPFPLVFLQSPQPLYPEVSHPLTYAGGTKLMMLSPGGQPEVLVDPGLNGTIVDPLPSFDARKIFYAHCYDIVQRNPQRNNLPRADCDLFVLDLATRQSTQLTFGPWEPSVDGPKTKTAAGFGSYSLSPAELPGNKLAFTSTRDVTLPIKTGYSQMNTQLYVLDMTTGITERISHLGTSQLHPVTMVDGRLLFSTHEVQGIRDERLWGIWSIFPDGRMWEPMDSAFKWPLASHFHMQRGDKSIVSTLYYNFFVFGSGALYSFASPIIGQVFTFPRFSSPVASRNPWLTFAGQAFQWGFTPANSKVLTPVFRVSDGPTPGNKGKITHPSPAPANGILAVHLHGAVNRAQVPTGSTIVLLPTGMIVTDPGQMPVVYTPPPGQFVLQPKAVVSYRALYGLDQPATLPWLPQSTHPMLPPGTPYGLIGWPSLYQRESFPGKGPVNAQGVMLDTFNSANTPENSNWDSQGADAGRYTNAEIHALRIVTMAPTSFNTAKPPFTSHGNERLRILGDIPVRKRDSQGKPLMDTQGNPDTSGLVRIPADMPFTFQTIDKDGLLLNMSQTWHQLRPGEIRADCGGCHSHSQQPLEFPQTAAGAPAYIPDDLTQVRAWSVNYGQDVRPLLAPCQSCHGGTTPAGGLRLDDTQTVPGGLPKDYATLAADEKALYSPKPPGGQSVWRYPNASRYIRKFQARRSLLGMKIMGRRTDGWANAERADDLDYVAGACQAHTVLTEQDKRRILAWIDLGAPYGTAFSLDELKPTVALHDTGSALYLGMADVDSALALPTLTVTRDGMAQTPQALGDGRWSLPRAPGRWKATVVDASGNRQTRELVVAGVPVTAGQVLYERCTLPLAWSMLTPVQHFNWEACAQQ